MLQKGASVPWKDQLEDFLGDGGKMNADDLLAYFKPLDEYLKKYLAENNIKVGTVRGHFWEFHSEGW